MFKIIGADQKEYGPVSADELRQWIAEGRANGQTLVQSDGGPWRPLSSLPEFAAHLPALSVPPALSPPPPFAPGLEGDSARQQLNGPAIGLIATGALGILQAVGGMLTNLLGAGLGGANFGAAPELERIIGLLSGTLGTALYLVSLAISLFVLYGGLRLRKLQNYGLCIVASVLALFPCTSPCCCIGLPVGIWALVVLNRPEVRSQFPRG
jgi:hypothetical protein